MRYYKIISSKNLDSDYSMFDDLKDKSLIKKLNKLNRPCIVAQHNNECYIGCIVFCRKQRAIKINLLYTHPGFRNQGIAKSLLKLVLNFINDDFSDYDVVYSVANPDNEIYQELLTKSGFQIQTVKANGELVFTYGKSI